jgi:RHH-type transcriptional regulator, rel operon repressor / antitoxin RelB
MKTAISVRIPDNLAIKLSTIAKKTENSKSFHIQKALELYFQDMADLQIALDRLNDPSDSVISFDSMRKRLEL